MGTIKFSNLIEALPKPEFAPRKSGDLIICDPPQPFVAPHIRISDGEAAPLGVEILYVEAPAAVGKTTMARFLSAETGIPFLDLSEVPAATGTLQALISNLDGPADPTDSFHEGELPIILDALDEGRLLSGESSFESFLETAAGLLSEDRSVTDKPKLIVFGRRESIADTRVAFEIFSDATSRLVNVDFFDKEAARSLVHAYAEDAARPDSAYLQHRGPADEVIENYFSAIEGALGLDEDTLWDEGRGRAFAGYAPVLAALGSLIAAMRNFQDVANRLRKSATREAWDVLETVIGEILDRERDQLQAKLAEKISAPVPDEAYDRQEQLTLLTRYTHGQKLRTSNRVELGGADLNEYVSMAERRIKEHPFVQGRSLTNIVLGSVVLAHAVANDLLDSDSLVKLAEASRQPFLWRSLHRQVDQEDLLAGTYLGYVLRSFWNDPITTSDRCTVRPNGMEGAARVSLANYEGKAVSFTVTTPVRFYAEVRDCSVELEAKVAFVGAAPRKSQRRFTLQGDTAISASTVEVLAEAIAVDGQVWLESKELVAHSDVQLSLKPEAEVGWGGAFSTTHPWNTFQSTVEAPKARGQESRLVQLLRECRDRLPPGVLILQDDFAPVEDEARMGWVRREFQEEFPQLIGLMVDQGLARVEDTATEGTIKKIHVRFNTSWEELYRGIQAPEAVSQNVRDFLSLASGRLE